MMTDRSGDGGIPFSPSRRTDNLPAEARPLQETAQSGGGWHLSWCGVGCLDQSEIPDSPGIRRTRGRTKGLRGVTASLGRGKNFGLVEPMLSIEQR
jgi:hypothetical protein